MKKLNLGCGPHALEGWFNYDIGYPENKKVVPWDLSTGKLPHNDASVDLIYSEHFIEHITYEEAEKILLDCFRVLRRGGIIRISTPDLRNLSMRYLSGKNDLISMPGVWEPKTPCQMINEGMRSWGHKYLYDEAELATLMLNCGFDYVTRCHHKKSTFSDDLNDLEIRPDHNDLILEAAKV